MPRARATIRVAIATAVLVTICTFGNVSHILGRYGQVPMQTMTETNGVQSMDNSYSSGECSVELLQQNSKTACRLGKTYGCRNGKVWTSKCRGLFRCADGAASGITCGSLAYHFNDTCRCDGADGSGIVGQWYRCGRWSNATASSAAAAQQFQSLGASSHGEVVLLALGIISSPKLTENRQWIRRALWAYASAHGRNIEHGFVFGYLGKPGRPMRRVATVSPPPPPHLALEQASYGDMVFVDAADGNRFAVAEKTLAWYKHAALFFSHAQYIGKMDDDTYPNLRTLLADLRTLNSPVLYYGSMQWRLWIQNRLGACGPRGVGGEGPPRQGVLRMQYDALATEECANAVGPYPFADGSLEILGQQLLQQMVKSAATVSFIEQLASTPRRWLHEDVGIGYLVHQAVASGAAVLYVTIEGWKQNLFWVDPKRPSTLPNSEIVWTHHVGFIEVAAAIEPCVRERWFDKPSFPTGDCMRSWSWPDAPSHAKCATKARR